jgi:hypothetical protein
MRKIASLDDAKRQLDFRSLLGPRSADLMECAHAVKSGHPRTRERFMAVYELTSGRSGPAALARPRTDATVGVVGAAQQGAGADGAPVPGCARHGAPRHSAEALGGGALCQGGAEKLRDPSREGRLVGASVRGKQGRRGQVEARLAGA